MRGRHAPDRTGERHGRLVVLYRCGTMIRGRHAIWACDCDCGRGGVPVTASNLASGTTRSCGCLNRELSRERMAAARALRHQSKEVRT